MVSPSKCRQQRSAFLISDVLLIQHRDKVDKTCIRDNEVTTQTTMYLTYEHAIETLPAILDHNNTHPGKTTTMM